MQARVLVRRIRENMRKYLKTLVIMIVRTMYINIINRYVEITKRIEDSHFRPNFMWFWCSRLKNSIGFGYEISKSIKMRNHLAMWQG